MAADRMWRLVAILGIAGLAGSVAYVGLSTQASQPSACPSQSYPPGETPLASFFALGAPVEGSSGGLHTYTFSVQSAGEGLLWSQVSFGLRTQAGTVIPTNETGWQITVLSMDAQPLANYSLNGTTPGWVSPSSIVVTTSQSVELFTPEDQSLAARGNTFLVELTGCSAGSVSVSIP